MILGRSFQPASARAWQRQQHQLRQGVSSRGLPFFSQQHNRQPAGLSISTGPAAQLARRPRVPPATSLVLGSRVSGRRWETSATGDDNSGHIAAERGDGLLFIDNVFPLRVGNILAWRPWRTSVDYNDREVSSLLKRFTEKTEPSSAASTSSSSSTPGLFVSIASIIDPVGLVKRAIPDSLNLTITEIVPRLKDGGVFVKFRHPAGTTVDEIESQLAKILVANPVRPWFNPLFGCMRAGLVRGVPWLEDLASRVPSSRVIVEFCAPPSASSGTGGVGDASGSANLELSQETIYSLFRRYGKIAEISSQPFDSKILPRYATVDFIRMRDAVMARSCLHGHVVNSTTRLRMSYEQRAGTTRHLWDWLTSHPRIVIPILAALLATITVAVFDPIRTFFIRAHVQHSFALRDTQLWKWFERRTSAFVTFARQSYDSAADSMGISQGEKSRKGGVHSRGQDALMTHRRDLIESLHTWLLETAGTFIVVQGPRGSGKSELVVEQALHGHRDVLVIDCKPIVEARGESATIKKIANAIGYRPVFSWANNLSSLIDLAVQGTTGVKTGFSETLDEQLTKILQTATVALREVGLDGRHKGDVDANLNEDAYLEAHPERRPVIVLDNFGHRNEDATGLVYDKLAEWAATLVQANVAHVVFLTSDTSYPKALVKAMPDRVFRQIALGDLSPEVAMNYVLSHLAEQEQDEEVEDELPAPAADSVPAATSGFLSPNDAAAAAAAGSSTESNSATSVVTAIIDAKKAKEAKEKADVKESEQKPQSIIEKVSLPFQMAKDAVVTAASAKSPPVIAPAAPAETNADPSSLNTAAAKAALALEGGLASATAVTSPLTQAQQEIISELDSCIGVLGGRLTDLESLVRRLKSGQTPKRAVSEIVEQSASEIIKMFLLSQSKPGGSGAAPSSSASAAPAGSPSASGRLWTAEQAWHLVREIAANGGSVCYNDVLLSDTFASSVTASGSSGIAALDALAAAELVTVRSHRGRPQMIKPGSPVYLAAFQFLGSDKALAARLDRCVLAEKAAVEAKTVAKVEQELAVLGTLWRQPAQTNERIVYLLNKLQASQAKIEAYEAEMAKLKKVMSEKA
ncbi:mitochondrial escape protein 2 [Ophiostoma piceae UAMH 11346]|uniref:Mitochondrial escape protein 2 n=1 Tax=Ophiostoma piceae (strain UAMH 11346) TaxID=1262450 RepID=S3BTJ4_OPHP1|nr:mitochondrial escape protein 2 [Ophiostoma piceae UAMH 11346]